MMKDVRCPISMYRVEQEAPRGAMYADAFFDVFAYSEKEAWKKAFEYADSRVLRVSFVKVCGERR